ncbi:unnamed protein product [Anisakis simplex]|uniref:C-type lectin domain-containing protein n=1 Tax=Anisakis simplex TaxID=6269 RepID=A0A0M3KAP2_ANISI|nr:unnamed protein product [Anisakis simplex]
MWPKTVSGVGLMDTMQHSVDGQWVRYPKSEPNALCVAMNTMTGFWQNKDCANRLPFFCSIDSISFPRGGNATRRYEGLLEATTKKTDDLLDELSALDRANRNETK